MFGQMDNHDNHTLAAPDAPRKVAEKKDEWTKEEMVDLFLSF